MNIKTLLIGLSSLLFLGATWAQTDTGGETGGLETGGTEMTAPEGETVVDLITSDPELSTLYEAVLAAGLETALTDAGPYTIFAPSNDAFVAAGIDLATVDPTELQTILLYHVAAGDYPAADVATLPSVTSLEGSDLTLSADDAGGVTVDGAAVVVPDLTASNGTVHVIDTVLVPGGSSDTGGDLDIDLDSDTGGTMDDSGMDDSGMDDSGGETGG